MADAGHEATEKILKKLERQIGQEYATATREMEAKLQAYLEKTEKQRKVQEGLLKEGKITKQEYSDWCFRHNMVGKRWEQMRDTLAEDMHHTNEIAKGIMEKRMPDVYALNANYATYKIEHDARIDTGFTLYNHDTAEYLLGDQRQLMPAPSAKKAREIAANVDMQWNKQKIQSAVLQGVLQGESPYAVAERLRSVGQMNYNSSVRYARTMTTSAQNAGRYEAYRRARDLGVDLTIEWQATLDHRTRHAHRMMHGQRTEVDKPFHTPDGYTIYYPADCTGESNAPQKEIWNCRCTLLSWVKGYEGDTVKSSPKIKDMSYEEWKNEKQHEQNPVEYHTKENFNKKAYDSLTPAQKADIANYTVGDYKTVNNVLRGYDDSIINTLIDAANKGMVTTPEARTISTLDSFLEKNTLKSDTMLYRGLGHPSSLAKAMGIQPEQLGEMVSNGSMVGQRFMEKAFCSTSVLKESAFDSLVKLEILAPEGTKGMYIGPISSYTKKAENEFLLQRKTIFEVGGVETKYHKDLDLTEYILKVKIVGQG